MPWWPTVAQPRGAAVERALTRLQAERLELLKFHTWTYEAEEQVDWVVAGPGGLRRRDDLLLIVALRKRFRREPNSLVASRSPLSRIRWFVCTSIVYTLCIG